MDSSEQLFGYSGEETDKEKLYEVLNLRRNQIDSDEDFSRNVALLLLGMGMEKYIELFQKENISLDVLSAITIDDLRAIGVENDRDITEIQDKFCCVQAVDKEEVFLKPSDDTAILKGMVEQTNKLSLVILELALKLRRAEEKLVDKPLSPKYTQLQVLYAVLDQAIAQTETNLRLLYADKKSGLVNDIVEKEKLKLPAFLENKLASNKKIRKPVLFLITVSVVSIGIALVRFIT